MKPVPLDTFLAQMASLLDGTQSARALERAIGRSPSGTARLGLYATLVERQQVGALDGFYAAARVAAGARFRAFAAAFLREHPPSHWAPAAAAEHFGAFLERSAAPADVCELADYAWTRHSVLHAPLGAEAGATVVRHYTCAVRDFSHRVERLGVREGRPAAVPETLIIGRAAATAELVVLAPSLAALVALQVVADRGWSDELPAVPRAQVRAEAEHLCRLGLLPSSATAWVGA